MQLSLHNGSSSGVTIISNIFIDYYMPRANGEFVKIYLYLLRSLQSGDTALDLAAVADVFDCTESDVLRTLSGKIIQAEQLESGHSRRTQGSLDIHFVTKSLQTP